jgi:ribosomal protein L19
MKEIAEKINKCLISEYQGIDPQKFALAQKLIVGDKICIKYSVSKGVTKMFDGILVCKKRLNQISAMIHVLNHSLDIRIEKSFFLYSPDVSIVSVTKLSKLRKANSRFLMKTVNIRKILNRGR